MHAINDSLFAILAANLDLAPGCYSGTWTSYELRVESTYCVRFVETPIGIRGTMRVVVRIADDGTITVTEAGEPADAVIAGAVETLDALRNLAR